MIRFKAIETKSISDADCMNLLTPGPKVLMERFRDVACQSTKKTMPEVTFPFLHMQDIILFQYKILRSEKK